MITRRTAVLFTLATPGFHRSAFASNDFWNEKKSEEWSSKEIERVLTRSPWAKEVDAVFSGSRPGKGDGSSSGRTRGRDSNSGMIDAGMAGGGGGGRGRGGSGGGMDDDGGQSQHIKALVRWETASPVAAAKRKKLPSSVEGQYVVSVTGVPMMGGGNNPHGMEDRLKEATMLERKGREPMAPSKVTGGRTEGTTMWIFFFPHGSQPIDADDKEVTFKTKIGPLEVRAKFALKDMRYQGQLAL